MDDDDPATQAFVQLKAEVALLRHAIEGLAGAEGGLAVAPDYSPTLGKMSAQLEVLHQQGSALRAFTPTRVTAEIQAATSRAKQEAQAGLTQTQARLDEALRILNNVVRRPRDQQRQRRCVVVAVLLGMVAGIGLWVSLSGPVARALPYRWQVAERLAAATLGQDRWGAGVSLMRGANLSAWARMSALIEFENDNHQALEACRQAAAKAGTSLVCKVRVRPSQISQLR